MRRAAGRCMRARRFQFAGRVACLRALAFVAAFGLLLFLPTTKAAAQGGGGCQTPPCPLPAGTGFANIASSSATFDLVTIFLNHQSRQMAASRTAFAPVGPGGVALAFGDANDPLAAYAANVTKAATTAAPATPRYRAWLEGYDSVARTGAQGTFTGDRRNAYGGIAGVGATLAPGVNLGLTIDQGHTSVDVSSLPQKSAMDVTQLGGMLSLDSGPWTLGVAGIYGFGNIRASRIDTGGEAVASYGTKMWGAIVEASYYWSSGGFRLVPKAGFDFTHVSVDAYRESGGVVPVAGSAQTTDRARVYGALELGRTTQAGSALYDFSIYGKLIDIVSQRVGSVIATPIFGGGFAPATVPGVVDARLEYATGAGLAVRFSSLTRVYLNYDGRFRDGYDSHGGTVGLEVRF